MHRRLQDGGYALQVVHLPTTVTLSQIYAWRDVTIITMELRQAAEFVCWHVPICGLESIWHQIGFALKLAILATGLTILPICATTSRQVAAIIPTRMLNWNIAWMELLALRVPMLILWLWAVRAHAQIVRCLVILRPIYAWVCVRHRLITILKTGIVRLPVQVDNLQIGRPTVPVWLCVQMRLYLYTEQQHSDALQLWSAGQHLLFLPITTQDNAEVVLELCLLAIL